MGMTLNILVSVAEIRIYVIYMTVKQKTAVLSIFTP
jgi:hypothetical protein